MELDLNIDIVDALGGVNYLKEINDLSDKNKKHLGMMPYSALEHSYQRGEIFIATVDDLFAGYLLFRFVPRYRRLSITHLCIVDDFRQNGIPKLLIDSLKSVCISSNYNGIGLYCRRDYLNPSKVWKGNLFCPIGEKASRGADKDKFVTNWWWGNDSREDLFGAKADDSELVNAVLDMNVLINLKASDATVLHLLNDSLIEDVEFFVGRESLVEIDRHEDQFVRNEMREYTNKFHQLEFQESSFNRYVDELNTLLPKASDQEVSDIRQIAQTLASGKDVFITADEPLLERAQDLHKRYELNLLHPSTLWVYLDENAHSEAYQPVRLSGTSIKLRKVKAHEVQSIGSTFLHPNERKADLTSILRDLVADIDSSEVLVVCADDSMLALVAITDVSVDESITYVFRVLGGALAYTLSAQVVNFVLKRQAKAKTSKLSIVDKYSSLPEKLAKVFGFKEIENFMFKKLEFGAVSVDRLPSYLNQSVSTSNLPDFQLVDFFNDFKDKPLELEKALWPLKATDIDVPIYVIPIRAHWAMQLFDEEIAREDIFGSNPSLAFNFENVYYSATTQRLKGPGRLVWYVSGAKSSSPLSGSIRAVSYLDKVDIGTPKSLFSKYKRLGIYSWHNVFETAHFDLAKEIRALTFSRTELLKVPITLDDFGSIRVSLGNAKPNLAGPLRIDIDTFKCICERLY